MFSGVLRHCWDAGSMVDSVYKRTTWIESIKSFSHQSLGSQGMISSYAAACSLGMKLRVLWERIPLEQHSGTN